jgi:hypothetical protein
VLSIAEAAQTLGVAPRSADRLWAYARAWLHQVISGAARHDTTPQKKDSVMADFVQDLALCYGGKSRS